MEVIPILLLVVTSALSAVNAINVRKRSDDTSPLETVVMQLTTDLNKLQAQLTAQNQLQTQLESEVTALKARLAKQEQHAAFLAQFTSSGTNSTTPATGPFVYNHVIFNDGDAYDPKLGVFTAPYAGVYIFTTQFYTHGTQQSRPVVDMLLNGKYIIRMAFDSESASPGYEQDSHATSITVKLRAGDRVWVASAYHSEFFVYGSVHTFFSGALLFAE
ncbi:hypothetical protein BaRGS_00008484 [Batillaria attramentaria]|uniref:C1q domain-containing protein n=1 Tax=Batillaria attramentaria TaxID=370345 RepID=A0ABD0LL34_9CAEN